MEPAVLADGKEEFEIPEQIFDSVCGTDGSNLARMEQVISLKFFFVSA